MILRTIVAAVAIVLSATTMLEITEAGPPFSTGRKSEDLQPVDLAAPAGSWAQAINKREQVIGGWENRDTEFFEHAFLWEDGVLTELPSLGGLDNAALHINDRGQISGWSTQPNCAFDIFEVCLRAVLWQDGGIIDLGTLGGLASASLGLSERGHVVGVTTTADCPLIFVPECGRAFLWYEGVMTDLGTLGGPVSMAIGANSKGQVIGTSDAPRQIPNQFNEFDQHAFLWQNSVMVDLGRTGEVSSAAAINDAGQIVININVGLSLTRAFVWRDGIRTDLGSLGGGVTNAVAINGHGHIIGDSATVAGPSHAFLWRDGLMTDLGTLGGGGSTATALNDRDQVVGFSSTVSGEFHLFLWEDGLMIDLGPPTRGFAFRSPDINHGGDIVGMQNDQAFLWRK